MSQTPPNWDSLKTIVADALELEADQRDKFLLESCNGDPVMLEEVRSLVGAYEQADGVIDKRTDAWLGLGGTDLLSLGGQRIGRYTLQRLLAEGAMAAVYQARQINPERTVALKLVRCSLPLIDAATRFKRESQALGRLQHPNIARIYEAGVHQTGTSAAMPFIAMEYIDGPPLTQFARDRGLSRVERIQLMIKVASAVHAAHQQAVIHRDLKPANVLVDPSGEPKVLDFGIALIIGADEENRTWQTTAGVLLGTPGYMSPEQAAGKVNEVDVRSDVWALGVLLHELLTDRLPIDVRNTSIAEVLRRIETIEPQPISRFDRSLGGDLETVVMTALSREKQRRYPSAQALADDLRRVLEYEPISARPASAWYRTKKFIRRHRVGFAVAAMFLVLLAASAIVSSLQYLRASRERDKARAISTFLQEMMSSADPSVGSKDVTVLQAMDAAEGRIARRFADDPLTEAEVRSTLGWTYFNLGQYDRANKQMTRAVELRSALKDSVWIDDQSRLATILRWQYQPQEALKVAQSAYDASTKKFGAEHPSSVALLDPIAGAAYDVGDLQTAEREYLHAIEVNRKVMGPANEQTLMCMNNLAVVYIDAGKYEQAEKILRELVAVRSKVLPVGHPSLITTRLNLANALSDQGQFASAVSELRQLSIDAEKSLGADHDSTITIKSNLAEMLQRLGQVDEALSIQKDCLARRLAANGVDHDLTIKDASNYSSMLSRAKRFPEAQQYAQQALDASIKLHGPEHMKSVASRCNLAAALEGFNRYSEAESIYREAIAIYTKQFGEDHLRTLAQQNNLGHCLARQGRGQESLDVLQPTLQRAERAKLKILLPAIQCNLGRALLVLKRYDESERALLESYQLSNAVSSKHMAAKTAQCLVELYQAWQKPDEVRKWEAQTSTL